MRIYGLELLRGLSVTMSHFISSYTAGFKRTFKNRLRGQVRQMPGEKGIFTVQYPEERLKAPERFRVLPVLIFDGKEGETWKPETERRAASGICAKVCPPQCIWIVQDKDQPTAKPVAKASELFIDIDVCMNCGLCAEFWPFDAIKMDHDFELGSGERQVSHIFDINKLHVSTEYYAKTHPKAWTEEEARRKAEQEKRAAAKNPKGSDPSGSDPNRGSV